ncbi:hypothetical protein PENSPDRAFT_656881 [Peniophora sp. CONT]|nr:hypothetical protein PENSPDRAFT_656881 [Peniophora sp. CONT]
MPVNVTLPLVSPHQLSHLAFKNCYPPLPNPIFSPSITHLTLSSSFARGNPSNVISVNVLLNVLSSMTSLECLKLNHVPQVHAQPRHLPSSAQRLALPPSFRKLECLVGRDAIPATTFMSHIELPRGVEVSLGIDIPFDYEEHRIGGISDFARLSGTTLRATCMSPDLPWSLFLTHCEAYILLGDGKPAHRLRSPADILPWSGSHSNNALVHLARPTITQLTISDLNGLFLLLPLAHLKSLSISGDLLDTLCMDDFPEYAQIIDKILAVPCVGHLTLGLSDNAAHLLEKLAEIHSHLGQVPTAVSFPFLETITVGVEDRVDVDNHLFLKESLTPVFDALAAAVNARRNCANQVRELRVDRQLKSMYTWELVTGAAVVTV